MDEARFDELAERSEVVFGHRHVLPVAVWILESDDLGSFGQPEVRIGLEGRSPPNKISRALTRLEELSALTELPYLGRPHPRAYEKRSSAQWEAVREYAAEIDLVIRHSESGD